MRAIIVTKSGGPEVLSLEVRPDLTPSRGEVRVRVHAAGVNRADLLQRMGFYPAPPDAPADVPGLEYAGVVDALGDGVTDLAVGDRVFGLAPGGTYADSLTVHARATARLPDHLSFVEGAAVPEAFITAYDAIVSQGGLASGEVVLVHAAGSGVGTAAVQIGQAIGATVLGTARTPDKLGRAEALGMRHGVVAKDAAFAKEVMGLTGGRGVDVVLELVGGAYVAEDLRCVALKGRVMVVGTLAGASVDLDLGTLLRRRVTVRGTVLRSRPLEERIQVMRAFDRHLVPLFARSSGPAALKPVVDRVFALKDAGAAHTYVATNEGFGKVVLEVGP
jgi:putative PIG3 family NAD(P)H quinone oxidoreductase